MCLWIKNCISKVPGRAKIKYALSRRNVVGFCVRYFWKIVSVAAILFVVPWVVVKFQLIESLKWWVMGWWWVKLLVLTSFLWILFRRKINTRPRLMVKNEASILGSSGLVDDKPISRATEDTLSRGAFVSMLIELLKGFPFSEGAKYIGLYAPWGDGKTSVINLLKERMHDDGRFTFVDFEPWKYQSQEELPFVFFEHIARSVGTVDGSVGEQFEWLAKFIRLRYVGKRIGGINALIDAIRLFILEHELSEDVVLQKLRKLLLRENRKVVVVIDDLDRLPKEDVCRVIRFLKAHGDLPNVIYLIAADESYLAGAVGSMIAGGVQDEFLDGSKYLEKIIPLSRQLPVIDAERLLVEFERQVNALIDKYWNGHPVSKSLDYQIALPYLDNIRSLKRAVNALDIDLAFAKAKVGDVSWLGVDIGDYVALSILREFERKFYDGLPNARYELQKAMNWPYGNDDKGVLESWMEKHFWGLATPQGKENVKEFVLTRLGVTATGGHGKPIVYSLKYRDESDELLNYRLSSRLCFPCYFLSEVEDVQLYQGPLNEFLTSIANKRFPEELVSRLDREGKLPLLMYMLESQKVFEDDSTSEFFMRTLIRIGERVLRPVSLPVDVGEFTFRDYTIYERVFKCLFVYCRKLKMELHTRRMHNMCKEGEDHVGFVVFPMLVEENSLVMLERFIAMEGDEHKKGDSSADLCFTNEEFSKMEGLYVARIAKKQREDAAVNLTAFLNLFRSWMIILNKANNPEWNREFSAANDKWLSDYSVLTIMLIFFTDDERAARDVTYAVAADMGRLEKYWSQEQVDRIMSTLETATKKDERDTLFLAAYKFARNRKLRGDTYDKEAQFEYMKEHYREIIESDSVVE